MGYHLYKNLRLPSRIERVLLCWVTTVFIWVCLFSGRPMHRRAVCWLTLWCCRSWVCNSLASFPEQHWLPLFLLKSRTQNGPVEHSVPGPNIRARVGNIFTFKIDDDINCRSWANIIKIELFLMTSIIKNEWWISLAFNHF